jgi:small subunit ribosomal protein S16
MIKIRLTKQGKKNDHFFRVVAIEDKRKVTGKPLDIIGYWYPRKDSIEIDKDKLEAWIKNGALLSKKVKTLIQKA